MDHAQLIPIDYMFIEELTYAFPAVAGTRHLLLTCDTYLPISSCFMVLYATSAWWGFKSASDRQD